MADLAGMTAKNTTATKLEEQLKTGYGNASDEELMDACKQFEAYFLEQMFKAMQKTIPNYSTEGMTGSSNSLMDYYKEQMIQQVAADSTEQSSLGLAQMLYEQMKRNIV
ncbi:MAG: hypothetical protein HDR02_01475 [Lachnospiraceae bacterium]|nr:hypothetical protein [Lachnospiraceae bacterium]